MLTAATLASLTQQVQQQQQQQTQQPQQPAAAVLQQLQQLQNANTQPLQVRKSSYCSWSSFSHVAFFHIYSLFKTFYKNSGFFSSTRVFHAFKTHTQKIYIDSICLLQCDKKIIRPDHLLEDCLVVVLCDVYKEIPVVTYDFGRLFSPDPGFCNSTSSTAWNSC